MVLQPVPGAGATLPGDPAVGHAADGKAVAAVGAELQGGIDQLVEIAGQPGAIAVLGQGYEGLPIGWLADLKPMGGPALPLHLQHHGRQGKKTVVAIEVAGAHGQLRGHELVVNPQGFSDPARQVHLPARRTQAPDRAGPASAEHLKTFQMAHVVADQVGAGGPGG